MNSVIEIDLAMKGKKNWRSSRRTDQAKTSCRFAV